MRAEEHWKTHYDYVIVQPGSLPLNPEGEYDRAIEHRCTATLIWPAGATPGDHHSVLTDPCFTPAGYHDATRRFKALNASFHEVGWIFVTHPHRDHCSNIANFLGQPVGKPFRRDAHAALEGLVCLALPGHTPTQKGVLFRSTAQQMVCITGDAILNEAWLRAWKYYWPNFYQDADILQTWQSLALILSQADVIIPGHGDPFTVTAELLDHLTQTFDQAEQAAHCPDVLARLQARIERLCHRPVGPDMEG
jgi:glyoxylase-like metal-dependent hydrolase (beta-lactamase superfamily II)